MSHGDTISYAIMEQISSIGLYQFGGSEETVRHIQSRFIPRFRRCSPVLDIGCGRGIFLSMLRENGIECAGIDHSYESIVACRSKGFEVEQSDCISFLSRTTSKFGGIFCSHVIEHLPCDKAEQMLQLCRSALRPGGCLVIVTPNPEDINVMGNLFWLDPTHVRPYPGPLITAMLEHQGFRVLSEEKSN